MIKSERLLGRLAPYGFALDFESPAEGRVVFYRKASVPDLYERIELACRGHVPAGTPAVASAGVTIGRGPNAIAYLRVLTEIATVPRYGYTPLKREEDASALEERVAMAAPKRAAEMVGSHGLALLTMTDVARRAAREYFRRVGAVGDITDTERRLREHLTAAQLSQVDRICEWRNSAAFRVGAISIVLFRKDVEMPGADLSSLNPLKDPELMRRLLLLTMLVQNEGQL